MTTIPKELQDSTWIKFRLQMEQKFSRSFMAELTKPLPTIPVATYIPIYDKERQHKQLKRAVLQAQINLLQFEIKNEIVE